MSTITLTLEQNFASDEIGKHSSLFLNGAAGCGKSVIITEKLRNDSSGQLILCATTNKAASVLTEKLNTGVEVPTLHSVLGLKPVNDGSTKNSDEILEFHFPTTAKNNTCLAGKSLIIDESSMISLEMQNYLLDMLKHENLESVTFVGDKYQLPCVNGDPFDYDLVEKTIELTQVKRAQGDLLDYYNLLRTKVTSSEPFDKYKHAKFFTKEEEFVSYMKGLNCPNIIITYTNDAARNYSHQIDSQSIYKGQECNALSHCMYNHLELTESIGIRTNSSVKVEKLFKDYSQMKRDALRTGYEYVLPSKLIKKDIKNIQYAKISNEYGDIVYISVWNGTESEKDDLLLNQFTKEYRKLQDSIKSGVPLKIWNTYSKSNGYLKNLSQLENGSYRLPGHVKQEDLIYWNNFHALSDAVILRSKLVSTAHRAQGITVDVVGIDLDDLEKSKSKKLAYVALTRASKNIVYYKGI